MNMSSKYQFIHLNSEITDDTKEDRSYGHTPCLFVNPNGLNFEHFFSLIVDLVYLYPEKHLKYFFYKSSTKGIAFLIEKYELVLDPSLKYMYNICTSIRPAQ